MNVWAAAVPKPNPEEENILRAVGEALLWAGSSERWREVFRWCGKHPGHEITKTILAAYGSQGGDVEAALELGRDWEMIKEPIGLTRAFAEADGGDVEGNVQARLAERRRQAMMRAGAKKVEVLG